MGECFYSKFKAFSYSVRPGVLSGQRVYEAKLNYWNNEYIHQNSVVAGFVVNPEDWKNSSAGDFCEPEINKLKGVIELNYS